MAKSAIVTDYKTTTHSVEFEGSESKTATQMRRFELGTRIAIGAKRIDVVTLIIKDNAVAVGIGIVISLIIMLLLYFGFSEALASYLNSQLITLFVVTLVLIGVMALFAC